MWRQSLIQGNKHAMAAQDERILQKFTFSTLAESSNLVSQVHTLLITVLALEVQWQEQRRVKFRECVFYLSQWGAVVFQCLIFTVWFATITCGSFQWKDKWYCKKLQPKNIEIINHFGLSSNLKALYCTWQPFWIFNYNFKITTFCLACPEMKSAYLNPSEKHICSLLLKNAFLFKIKDNFRKWNQSASFQGNFKKMAAAS